MLISIDFSLQVIDLNSNTDLKKSVKITRNSYLD